MRRAVITAPRLLLESRWSLRLRVAGRLRSEIEMRGKRTALTLPSGRDSSWPQTKSRRCLLLVLVLLCGCGGGVGTSRPRSPPSGPPSGPPTQSQSIYRQLANQHVVHGALRDSPGDDCWKSHPIRQFGNRRGSLPPNGYLAGPLPRSSAPTDGNEKATLVRKSTNPS
jgi:hypothetical protein